MACYCCGSVGRAVLTIVLLEILLMLWVFSMIFSMSVGVGHDALLLFIVVVFTFWILGLHLNFTA